MFIPLRTSLLNYLQYDHVNSYFIPYVCMPDHIQSCKSTAPITITHACSLHFGPISAGMSHVSTPYAQIVFICVYVAIEEHLENLFFYSDQAN